MPEELPFEKVLKLVTLLREEKKMRKTILVMALVFAVAFAAFASESDPSNTVGFMTYQYVVGVDTVGFGVGFTPFMLPFNYYQPGYIATTSIDTIIGAQAIDGDEVWSQQRFLSATYFYGVWYGGYPLYNTDAYWYRHPIYSTPPNYVNITTAGEVNTAPINYGIIGTGFTPYGIPIVSNTLCSSLELEATGLDPIEVWDQVAYLTYYYFFGGWYPDGNLVPGQPIWINNTTGSASPNAWVYDPTDDPGRATTTVIQRSSHRTPIQTQPIERVLPSTPKRSTTPDKRSR
ncbi:hypothetical protein AMJ86_02850 [bacterium SM23_57]|nr:MAG: hypothetical protein AMJ86_02850 [bacterium SM23_57]